MTQKVKRKTFDVDNESNKRQKILNEDSTGPPVKHCLFNDPYATTLSEELWLPNYQLNLKSDTIGFFNIKFYTSNVKAPLLTLKPEFSNKNADVNTLSRSFRFYPTKEQKLILRTMEQAYRWTYNVTSHIIENKIQPFYTQQDYDNYVIKRYERVFNNKNKPMNNKQVIKWNKRLTSKVESVNQQINLLRNLYEKQKAFPEKDLTKQIDAKNEAIKKLDEAITNIKFKLEGWSNQAIDKQVDFHNDFEAIRDFLVTKIYKSSGQVNQLFTLNEPKENTLEYAKEKHLWLKNHPEIRFILLECDKDTRRQAVIDAINNKQSQITNKKLGHQQAGKGKTPYKKFKELKTKGFMVPIRSSALYYNKGKTSIGMLQSSKFGNFNFGKSTKSILNWLVTTFPCKKNFKDFKIVYNLISNVYEIIFPYGNIHFGTTEKNSSKSIASIDIGSKPRHAIFFSDGSILMTGTQNQNGKYDIERLCQIQAKKRQLQSKYDKAKNTKTRKKKKKKMIKISEKIHNIMKDADYKTIKMILDKADVPKMESDTRKKKCFNKKVRVDSTLYSHCQFVERLKIKAANRKKRVVEVIEPYTSKTCTRCLLLKNNLGSAKVFKCDYCGFIGDRDICGARNILILNRELFNHGFQTN